MVKELLEYGAKVQLPDLVNNFIIITVDAAGWFIVYG